MCLIFHLRTPAEAGSAFAAAATRAAAETGLRIGIPPVRGRGWLPAWAHQRRGATITEGGSCACSLLADDAEWSAAWSWREDVRERLARALQILGEGASSGIAVEALWAGDDADGEQRVSPGEMADLVRSGQMKSRTRYLLGPAHVSVRARDVEAG